MPSDAECFDIKQRFRGAYGRLCIMSAKALHAGHSTGHVIEAAAGRGEQPAPVYVRLRAQHREANNRLKDCKAVGVSNHEIVDMAHQARLIVQGEWMIRLPLFTP